MEQYLAIATALYTALSIGVRMWPTKQGEEIQSKMGKALNFLFEATKKR